MEDNKRERPETMKGIYKSATGLFFLAFAWIIAYSPEGALGISLGLALCLGVDGVITQYFDERRKHD